MITIIIAVLLCVLIWFIYAESEYELLPYLLTFGFVVGLFIATMLGETKLSNKEVKWMVKNTTNIVSIADGSNMYGRFILGSGTIEGQPCYIYYTGDEIKGYKISQIKAENVIIKEEENCLPRIVYKGWKRTKPFYKSFFVIARIMNEKEVIIYVPKGTIIKNFVLDSNL